MYCLRSGYVSLNNGSTTSLLGLSFPSSLSKASAALPSSLLPVCNGGYRCRMGLSFFEGLPRLAGGADVDSFPSFLQHYGLFPRASSPKNPNVSETITYISRYIGTHILHEFIFLYQLLRNLSTEVLVRLTLECVHG